MDDGKMMFTPALLAVALAACGDGVIDDGAAGEAVAEPVILATSQSTAERPTAAASPAATEGLTIVWKRFRTAVLDGDAATIRALSAPMVEQRGELDSTPVVKLTPAKVPAVLTQMIKAQSGEGAGTVGDALAALDATPNADTPTWARVGDFEFTRSTVGWRLSAFFYEPGVS